MNVAFRRFSTTLSGVLLGFILSLTAAYAADRNGTEMKERLIVGENVIEDWCDAILDARQEILVAVYKLTSKTALESLLERRGDGVEVRLILDERAARNPESLAEEARAAGLEVSFWPSAKRGKLHVKLTIIDRRVVILGSFNLTESAQKTNTELFYLSTQESLVAEALKRWESLQQRCTPGKP